MLEHEDGQIKKFYDVWYEIEIKSFLHMYSGQY